MVSSTTTLNEHEATFPEASVAVYETTVVPNGKVSPDVCELVKLTSEQLSDAVGDAQVTTAWQDASTLPKISDIGQPTICGPVLSWTMTSKEHVDTLPDSSSAV